MSLQPEEKDTLQSEEESTIFSAPVAHKESKKGSNMVRNGLLTTVLLLCIACLAASLWIFVPKMEEDLTSSNPEIDTTPLWSLKTADLDAVTLTEGKNAIEFFSVEEETETSSDSSTKEWHIKGVDNTLISMDKTGIVINAITSLEYLKVMQDTSADYGFASPLFKVDIKAEDSAKDKLLLIGSKTADESGVYLKIDGEDTVYLAETDFLSYLNVNPLYFADTTGLPAFSKDSDYTGEYFTDGALTNFDRIVIEGTNLSEKMTLEKNTGILDFGSYIITSPTHRYANTENVSGIYGVFTNGLSGTGVYSFKATAEEQKVYGLNNPDFTATLYAGNESRTFKAKKQTDGSYALVGDGLRVILKVDAKNLPFATLASHEFYSNFLFIESLTEVSTITVTEGSSSHKFEVITETKENDEGEKENQIKNIKANGKEIDTKNFQNYYEYLLWLSSVEFNFIDTSNMTADTTIKITHNDGTKDTVIKYYKISDMRYQVEINGEKMGVISASSYKTIFKYADNVANGKNYSS